ncbi:MAG: Multimodular transpeptidase-transglycosylase [Firmicutes bacterium]|nr:Multimodular transpeptidase-transglycosylase [Bacillota bacterium]
MTNQTNQTKRGESKRDKGPLLRFLGTLFLIAVVTGAMLACMAAMYIKVVIMPDVGLNLSSFSPDLTSTIYYTDKASGEQVPLQSLHGRENRQWVEYENIPQDLVDAAIAIEDKRFYKHNGVDWIGTANGIRSMFTGNNIRGGSTITQQLIKNLTQEDQVTVKRKIKEIFRALEFEDNYDKEEILEWYLNYIYLGEGCNGVYTASYIYFGKNVSELTLAECASLIGITNNPSLYNPYQNQEGNRNRQLTILAAMRDQDKITKAEYDAAVAQEMVFARGEDSNREWEAYSYYVDAVINQVIKDLMELGYSQDMAANMVYAGGLQIASCYEPSVQAAVDAVYQERANLNYTSSKGTALQSAITIINNETGTVAALAGGVGEKEGSRVLNRATDSKRPPGSSIKPLAVYGPALEMGLITPGSTEVDSPYNTEQSWPVNSYGAYRGPMTITEALRVSANTVAVKVLAKLVTPQVSYEFMRDRFHIQLVESRTVGNKVFSDIDLAPLALGGLTDGVTTYDMAAAFSAFPRGGVYYEPTLYTKVTDSKGEVLLEKKRTGEVILKEKTTYYMTSMLQTVVNSGTGTAAKFQGQAIAGKTGTTSSRKDLWFVGYTPYYTAAVWTGFDVQEAMRNVSGNPSTVLFRKVMEKVHQGLPKKDFEKPAGQEMIWVSLCAESGLRANEFCGEYANNVYLFREDVPAETCTIHVAPEPETQPEIPEGQNPNETPSVPGQGGEPQNSDNGNANGGNVEP